MKVKESDKNLFKKLEKMFGFNKNSDQLFVPKELAEKLYQMQKLNTRINV